METKELQKIIKDHVAQMDEKYKSKHDSEATFNHIIEEIGEVANQINKPKIRNEKIIKEELADEIADVFILLTHLASINDIDIEKCIINKIKKLKQRANLI